MECFACDQPATRHCPRCSKAFCQDHGVDLCAECLDPLNAAPSSTVFRASLFALLMGSVLALWLLVRPPSLPSEAGPVVRPEPTPQITPAGTKPAQSSPRPGATATPATGTGEPSETPAERLPSRRRPPLEYTVQEGDTWFGIAGPSGRAEDLAAVNGLTRTTSATPATLWRYRNSVCAIPSAPPVLQERCSPRTLTGPSGRRSSSKRSPAGPAARRARST
jgi:hypothetical protein